MKLSGVCAVVCIAVLGCRREQPKTEQVRVNLDGTNSSQTTAADIKSMNVSNYYRSEIIIWTNTAGTKAFGITPDGGVFFRMNF